MRHIFIGTKVRQFPANSDTIYKLKKKQKSTGRSLWVIFDEAFATNSLIRGWDERVGASEVCHNWQLETFFKNYGQCLGTANSDYSEGEGCNLWNRGQPYTEVVSSPRVALPNASCNIQWGIGS